MEAARVAAPSGVARYAYRNPGKPSAGDRTAAEELVDCYYERIYLFMRAVGHDRPTSEDLAQETFLAAWRHLSELREPSRLRSWLCGITRFVAGKELRRRGREPLHAAAPLDAIHDAPSTEQSPFAQAVSREEEAILWRALERIPDTYRDTMILFYREQQSVERVAAELDLSEDTVKQRLSRGRKLLHEEVVAFVEGALGRTGPGEEFSEAALPAAPWAAAPTIGIVGGIASHWLIAQAAPSARERRVHRFAFIALWAFVLGWCVGGQFGLRILRQHQAWSDRTFYEVMAGFWWFSVIVIATWYIVVFRRLLAIRRQSGEEAAAQLTPGARAAVVIGTYLGFFSWLIALAWRAHDQVSVEIIGGTMVVLGIWHFFQLGRRFWVGRCRAVIDRNHLRARSPLLAGRFRQFIQPRLWRIISSIANWDWKRNAGATQFITRNVIGAGKSPASRRVVDILKKFLSIIIIHEFFN